MADIGMARLNEMCNKRNCERIRLAREHETWWIESWLVDEEHVYTAFTGEESRDIHDTLLAAGILMQPLRDFEACDYTVERVESQVNRYFQVRVEWALSTDVYVVRAPTQEAALVLLDVDEKGCSVYELLFEDNVERVCSM